MPYKSAVLFSTKINKVVLSQTGITAGGESKFSCIGENCIFWLCLSDLHTEVILDCNFPVQEQFSHTLQVNQPGCVCHGFSSNLMFELLGEAL